ncbi:hypothetical protein LguiA_021640 [Lonicera macranthoides]
MLLIIPLVVFRSLNTSKTVPLFFPSKTAFYTLHSVLWQKRCCQLFLLLSFLWLLVHKALGQTLFNILLHLSPQLTLLLHPLSISQISPTLLVSFKLILLLVCLKIPRRQLP